MRSRDIACFAFGGIIGGVGTAFWLMAVLTLFGQSPSEPPVEETADPAQFDAPFEFQELESTAELQVGPTVILRLLTSDDVALHATEDQLLLLWLHLRPTIERRLDELVAENRTKGAVIGNRRGFVYLYTLGNENPWGRVDSLGEIETDITEWNLPAQ